MAETERLSGDQIETMGLTDWRPVLDSLCSRFKTGDFVTGLKLVTAITEAAEAANHHPDVDLRYPYVDIRLTSHDVGGKTQRDVDLARRISELAAGLGITADPIAATRLDMGIDTWDAAEIAPFWCALWGVPENESGEVVDPAGRLPTIWFQDTERHETPRQRWHPDVWVPTDAAQARIEAAVAAGGTVVSDEAAPSFTVLADPQGNKACVCTLAGRGH